MTFVLLVLFSWFALRARTRRQVLATTLVGVVTVTMVVVPTPVYALSIVDAIQAVLDVINGLLQDALNAINSVRTAISRFYQNVIWPVRLIDEAKALVRQMIGQYRGLMRSIFNAGVQSATLPATQALESTMRNQQVGDFGTLATSYRSVYGPVPTSTAASPQDRMMTDMDDAMAQANLKTLKGADSAGQLTLNAADQIEDAASRAAPGSAPFLTAAAVVASIQSQALTQRMIASELRQEAARLAHTNAQRKQGAAYASRFSGTIQKMVQPK